MIEKISEQDYEVNQLLRCLAPWKEKDMDKEEMGDWETTLATTMMVKILYLLLSKQDKAHMEKALLFFHPLDRAGLVYALLVYILKGKRMYFRSAAAQHLYNFMCNAIKG